MTDHWSNEMHINDGHAITIFDFDAIRDGIEEVTGDDHLSPNREGLDSTSSQLGKFTRTGNVWPL
jgi:hypothetical protein